MLPSCSGINKEMLLITSGDIISGSGQGSEGANVGKIGSVTRIPKTNTCQLAESFCSFRTIKEKMTCSYTILKGIFTYVRSLVEQIEELAPLLQGEGF